MYLAIATTLYEQTNLALIGTVFLPMTFLAGVYGMNFQEDGGYELKCC